MDRRQRIWRFLEPNIVIVIAMRCDVFNLGFNRKKETEIWPRPRPINTRSYLLRFRSCRRRGGVAMESRVEEKEGRNLLGSPTFKKLENGRFRCLETGHELLDKDKDSYSNSKRCRLGLIDYALTRNKPPLTMFNQDPSSRSKLVCKLTGDTVNKSEEHIWKHLNGKRFLNKLELVEAGKLTPDGALVDGEEQPADSSVNEKKKNKKKKKKKKKNKQVEQIISEERNSSDKESESEEIEFWMPPAGERWDFDDGKDRWGSDSESDEENNGAYGSDGVVEDDDEGGAVEEDDEVSEEVSVRTKKRVIEEVGPSSSASRKKKKKKKSKQTVT